MRASLLGLLAAALVLALSPWGVSTAGATECSPIPTVLRLECPTVPGAGAVGITSVPGVGTFVVTSGSFSCGPSVLPPATTSVSVKCVPIGGNAPCSDPLAFGAVDAATGTLTAQASCAGSPAVTASCSTSPFPNNFCMGRTPGVGSFAFVCTVTAGAGSSLQDFVWWAECAQPVP